jgi:hypothetical protein
MTPPSISWPTRDRWTAERQPRYPDGHLSMWLSAFATKAEIIHVGTALERLRETLGGVERRRVTEAIKKLRDNTLPHVTEVPEAQRLLEPLHRRRWDMHELHKRAWNQHRDARPVDDAAWEAELQRRAAIESEFAAAWAKLEPLNTSQASTDNEATEAA